MSKSALESKSEITLDDDWFDFEEEEEDEEQDEEEKEKKEEDLL